MFRKKLLSRFSLAVLFIILSGDLYSRIKIKTVGGMEFVYIKGGNFFMGAPSDQGFDYEHPRHRVYLDSFWIGRYEVTQEQYVNIMNLNPSAYKGKRRPVETVSWYNSMDFCGKFSKKHGVKARLPYEAEWEYAARAGSKTKFYWGNRLKRSYTWYRRNSRQRTHPVGKKKPNRWGLYDMSGNVWEWCMDWYSDDYYQDSPLENPTGPVSGIYRVLRGGSWADLDTFLRTSYRNRHFPAYTISYYDYKPGYSESNYGFRILIPASR